MTFKYSKLKLLYDLLDLVKSNFLFVIVFFVLNASSTSTLSMLLRYGFILYLVLTISSRIVEIFFTKVEFANDGIRVYTGMFSKSERFIPRDKFENVQTSANVLQRLFGAETITMETGEATSDVTLKFVKKAERANMEAYVLSKAKVQETASQEVKSDILFTPSIQDILKASLLSFSFFAIIPITINIWTDLGLDKNVEVDTVQLPVWLIVLLSVLALLAAIAVGIFMTFNSYYGYQISMDAERIYVQKGWLSKQSLSIRKEKVQAVVYKQSGYQKLLGVTTVKLISTGEILSSDDQQINEFFPYLPTAKAHALVEQMLPQFTLTEMTHRTSKKARKLIWLRPPIFAAIVLLLGLWKSVFFYVGALVFVLTYVNRIRTYKNTAFELRDEHAQLRTGAFTIETLVTRRPKLIELSFERSILQRWAGVMSVKLTNRAQPIRVTELLDVDPELQQFVTTWFEQRANEVQIDPKSRDGALKKEAIALLATTLKKHVNHA